MAQKSGTDFAPNRRDHKSLRAQGENEGLWPYVAFVRLGFPAASLLEEGFRGSLGG